MPPYSLQLIQAVNDWQRGGNPKQKNRRGATLKALASTIPLRLRQTTSICFRQIALSEEYLRQVGTEYELLETISSWTTCETVAKDFKGGVPPKGAYQGVIFSVIPPKGSVIIDLHLLFEDEDFWRSVEINKDAIVHFDKGIGRYKDTQKEVVIELDRVSLDALYAWGGYSSNEYQLATLFYGKPPNECCMNDFRKLMEESGHRPGPYWLTTKDAVKRVNERLRQHAGKVTKRNRATRT